MNRTSHGTGRPEAALAVWDWQGVKRHEAEREPRRRARARAGIQALIAAVLGALFFLFGSRGLAALIWSISAFVLGIALASPDRLYPRLQGFFERFARALGMILTWLLLVPLFYLFFTPFGLLLRSGSRDRLERRRDEGVSTYWKKKTTSPLSTDAYRRQF